MAIIDNTTAIGGVISNLATNVAGSTETAILMVIILLIGVLLMFRLPLELIAILILPVAMVGAFYFSSLMVFWGLAGLVAIFLIARRLFDI